MESSLMMYTYFFFLMIRRPPRSTRTDTLFPYTTLFRSAVAALAKEPVVTLSDARTTTVVNARITPTPAFQRNPDLILDQSLIVGRLQKRSPALHGVDATGHGLARFGDTIAANPFMLGRSEEHTTELPSLMRISSSAFRLKKKT